MGGECGQKFTDNECSEVNLKLSGIEGVKFCWVEAWAGGLLTFSLDEQFQIRVGW